MNDFDTRRQELTELAFIDQSANYEVDQTSICYDRARKLYCLLTASGCSCWGGEYNEETFGTWAALKRALLNESRDYNPSLAGAEQLLGEAETARKRLKL